MLVYVHIKMLETCLLMMLYMQLTDDLNLIYTSILCYSSRLGIGPIYRSVSLKLHENPSHFVELHLSSTLSEVLYYH